MSERETPRQRQLRQLRLKLHHARTLALEVQLAAARLLGSRSDVETEAGRTVAAADVALDAVDWRLEREGR